MLFDARLFFPLFGFSSLHKKESLSKAKKTALDADFMTVAALSSEETDIGKFRSGGLGLRGRVGKYCTDRPESAGPYTVVYQEKTYKVTYQQDLVWQIEKSWGTTSPTSKKHAHAFVAISHSIVTCPRPSQNPMTPLLISIAATCSHSCSRHNQQHRPKKKAKRRRKDLPTEDCVVVHQPQNRK